jgi:endogenous inhibitor of DNA gyrase (YacG/DUF329 family)
VGNLKEAEMTKTFSNTTKVTCNRCAHEDVWIPETPDYIKWEWSEFTQGNENNGHKKIVMDICPKCTREVKTWIRNGR